MGTNNVPKPFDRMTREEYYQKVVHGGERPVISKKIATDLAKLMTNCWDIDPTVRPAFQHIVLTLAEMSNFEKSKKTMDRTKSSKMGKFVKKLTPTQHSTWF